MMRESMSDREKSHSSRCCEAFPPTTWQESVFVGHQFLRGSLFALLSCAASIAFNTIIEMPCENRVPNPESF